ncbi:DUF4252 domain-containing protein [Autumnicola edwardsiae]|jgi:hypothetical protein|uniref:DUF4252 domain-containing protein n=1 Tax=Autumnicola edwardsiae TaxID=3075594 RepID=A0ABU3CSF4_9FLAO|nr:DUF4252 domain-containing protein [Zunongwangia sp. F297]MDT0649168.1 DUF4252 domain-containing protein [Zunongwangia sp. F297]
MRTIIFLVVIALSSVFSNAQSFEKYDGMKGVDGVVMTSKMFKMLADLDLSDSDPEAQQYLRLIENLKEIKMFTTKDSRLRSQMNDDVTAYLKKGSLEQLMRVTENGKTIKFYSRPGKNDTSVSELFMFMEGQNEGDAMSMIVKITGEIDLSQLSKLASDLKVPGAEELKNVNNKS